MTDATDYTPPKVWTWDSESGGTWAKINRPIAGATHEKVLPRGQHHQGASLHHLDALLFRQTRQLFILRPWVEDDAAWLQAKYDRDPTLLVRGVQVHGDRVDASTFRHFGQYRAITDHRSSASHFIHHVFHKALATKTWFNRHYEKHVHIIDYGLVVRDVGVGLDTQTRTRTSFTNVP